MPLTPDTIKAFRTAFGRNLLAEIPNFVAAPYLIVTMEDLWPLLKAQFPQGTPVWLVRSMERTDLEAALSEIKTYTSIIGLGGVCLGEPLPGDVGSLVDCSPFITDADASSAFSVSCRCALVT